MICLALVFICHCFTIRHRPKLFLFCFRSLETIYADVAREQTNRNYSTSSYLFMYPAANTVFAKSKGKFTITKKIELARVPITSKPIN